MSFIAKNPLTLPEIDNSPPAPPKGTRGLFASEDGWYDIDSNGNVHKIPDKEATGETITVDTELNIESTNAIQNKAVAKAISNIPVVVVTIALNSPTFTESDELNKLTDKKLYRLQHDSSEICGWLFCSKRDGAVGNECEQLLIDRDNNIYRRKSTYINEDEYGWTEWERFATLGDVTDNIKSEINKIIDGSPEALDTLYELAKALGNDENFSATVMAEIGKKADKASLEEAESDIARILDGRASVGKAIRDSKGNYIHTYYATKEEIYNKLNSQKYYGDMNIVPTDSSLFGCYFDEDELTVEIYGFLKEENIEELVIPYEIKKDGLSYRVNIVTISPAFENNIFLKTVIFPSSLDVIGDTAFKGCTNLEKVVFSKGNTQIWAETFCNCTKLKSITLPDTIISIQEKAFDGSGLTDVYYEGTKEQWDLISISEDNETLLNASIHFNWSEGSEAIKTISNNEVKLAPVGIYKLDYGDGTYGHAIVNSEGACQINPDGSLERPFTNKCFAEWDLSTGKLDGSILVQKAIADKNGNDIAETYATKEEVETRVKVWTKGNEYSAGDLVLAQIQTEGKEKFFTVILQCIKDHTAPTDYMIPTLDELFSERWNYNEDFSLHSKYDSEGNVIVEHYATKEEVTTQIGDIETSLENIINKYGLGGEAV